ncbi:MAG TPA: hypothetical protein VFQ33_16340 [Xanthobacteraceae bacterium]|jgi:hypothetical protein|nr:hypothetical protein [Xanthobacteraceae bacterium]
MDHLLKIRAQYNSEPRSNDLGAACGSMLTKIERDHGVSKAIFCAQRPDTAIAPDADWMMSTGK